MQRKTTETLIVMTKQQVINLYERAMDAVERSAATNKRLVAERDALRAQVDYIPFADEQGEMSREDLLLEIRRLESILQGVNTTAIRAAMSARDEKIARLEAQLKGVTA